MFTVSIGDRVAYSAAWLRSTGQQASTDDIGGARGVVSGLTKLGGITLAEVRWDRGDFPTRVNVQNLAVVGPNTRFCSC